MTPFCLFQYLENKFMVVTTGVFKIKLSCNPKVFY